LWHQEHGYRGGLVLRELTRPLYDSYLGSTFIDSDSEEEEIIEPIATDDDTPSLSPEQLHQRECYYLYYEVKPDGRIVQQIFCRGTTLTADVFTCLNATFTYDSELGIRLHRGFRNHAHRLVNDVEPLLSNHPRATVELCGHSLGGAVAIIAAAKLRSRGYTVARVTAIAAPRFVENDDAAVDALSRMLPNDTLRIEDDLDGVPFLPPIGFTSVGHKLWFVRGKDGKHSSRFIPCHKRTLDNGENKMDRTAENYRWWVDSFAVNTRVPETALAITRTHRIPSYVNRIHELVQEMDD